MPNEILPHDRNRESLLISIINEGPLSAASLADLLSNLSKDYGRRNRGRTLVVASISSGSFWIDLIDLAQNYGPYIKDGMDAIKGGKALIEFGKGLEGAIRAKKASSDIAGEEVPKKSPYKSVDDMVKIAADTGSEIRIQHNTPDGSTLIVELLPPEAIRIRERSQRIEERRRLVAAPSGPASAAESDDISAPATEFVERIQFLTSRGGDDVDLLIGVLADALVSFAGPHALEAAAMQLELKGYYDLAAKVRSHGRGGAAHQTTTA